MILCEQSSLSGLERGGCLVKQTGPIMKKWAWSIEHWDMPLLLVGIILWEINLKLESLTSMLIAFQITLKSNWVSLERGIYLFWLSTLQTSPGARADCCGLSFHQHLLWLYKPDSAPSSHFAAGPLSGIKPHFQVHPTSPPRSVGTGRNQAKKSITPYKLLISLGDCVRAANEFKSLSHSNNSSRSVQTCLCLTKLYYEDKGLSMVCLCIASQKKCQSLNEVVELEIIYCLFK